MADPASDTAAHAGELLVECLVEALIAGSVLSRHEIAAAMLRAKWIASNMDVDNPNGPVIEGHLQLIEDRWSQRFGLGPDLYVLEKAVAKAGASAIDAKTVARNRDDD